MLGEAFDGVEVIVKWFICDRNIWCSWVVRIVDYCGGLGFFCIVVYMCVGVYGMLMWLMLCVLWSVSIIVLTIVGGEPTLGDLLMFLVLSG